MEQEVEMETVYYVETPYAANEEEIATSYISIENTEVVEGEELDPRFGDSNIIESTEKCDVVNEENSTVVEEMIVHNQIDEGGAEVMDVNAAAAEEIMVVPNQTDESKVEADEENSDVEDVLIVNNQTNETGLDQSELGEKSEGTASTAVVDKLTCRICMRKFSKLSNKQRHIRRVHNIKRQNETNIRCIECSESFCQLKNLRQHLIEVHNLDMSLQYLRFPNMEAFKKWKCEIERQTVCSFTLRHGARKGPQGPKYFYACHRSGKYLPKVRGTRQRMLKTQGSCKLGIMCTAAISVEVTRADVCVTYCPNHYGHGRETTLIQLTAEEQTAITESVSKGIPYETLLDEIRDSQSSKDHFQLHLLKKKDYRSINNSYSCEDFNTGMSDADSVDHWVNLCSQMENSPILFYRKESERSDHEEFLLIIMTEFQKHILLSSDKNVLCVDSLYRKKGGRFYLTVLFIMDENELAFPVAFCISNKVDKNIISLFFQSIYESTGPLECTFFMSDSEPFYYESWKEVMNDNSKWLWSMWYVDSRFRIQLRVFRRNVAKRTDAYKTMRMLLECQNQMVFHCMLENFIESLRSDPESKDLSNIVKNHYAPNAEIWAYCYRKEIDLATNIHLEIMHRTFRYCCREGRKKRLDKFIFVIMKVVRDKMLDRLTYMMDEERMELALETINVCHNLGLEILPEQITALSEKTWLIRSFPEEENYYVMLENSECPEHCNLKCSECDICVHMYICSCIHNLINANLCQHIHAVVWHLLTPHFTPPTSPVPLLNDVDVKRDTSSDFLQKLLKKTHEVYKQIQANKCNLNKIALNSLMKRMNECIEICSGKVLDKPPPVTVFPTPTPSETVPMQLTQSIPPTITNPGTLYVINSVPKQVNNQPVVLPNPIPSGSDPNSFQQGMGGYFIILPKTNDTNTNSTPNSNIKTE